MNGDWLPFDPARGFLAPGPAISGSAVPAARKLSDGSKPDGKVNHIVCALHWRLTGASSEGSKGNITAPVFVHRRTGSKPCELVQRGSLITANEFSWVEIDFTTSTELAQQYLESIKTPRKEFVLIKSGGHFAVFMRSDQFLQELARVGPPAQVQ